MSPAPPSASEPPTPVAAHFDPPAPKSAALQHPLTAFSPGLRDPLGESIEDVDQTFAYSPIDLSDDSSRGSGAPGTPQSFGSFGDPNIAALFSGASSLGDSPSAPTAGQGQSPPVPGGKPGTGGDPMPEMFNPELPLPYVRLVAIDPTAAKYRVDGLTGTSSGAFAVYRGGDLTDSLTINYTVAVSSTAVAGTDYQTLTGSVTIQPGYATAGILVRPLDNANGNSTKTVAITLSSSVDYVVGTTGTYSVSIVETKSSFEGPIQVMGTRPEVDIRTLDANAAELPFESSTGLMHVQRMAVVATNIFGGNIVWTHPAAVNVLYGVSTTPTAGSDYLTLSGSASLGYAVFATEVKITPLDDSALEGAETLTLTITPHSSYDAATPSMADVTIQDDENPPTAPQANADEFAMGAEMSSLSIDPAGVLFNDYVFSPGAVTAVLHSNTSSGTVTLNANGGFVYVPNAAIRETGGSDSFSYKVSQGSFVSLTAIVKVHVVKVTITAVGVPHADNMTVGQHVQVNANNDNGSVVTNEIPAWRDFQFGSFQSGQHFGDVDLLYAGVTVTPNIALPGFFTVTVAQGTDYPEINLYSDIFKSEGVGGVYTSATLPDEFYIEGLEPSTVLRGSTITVQYMFVGANGLPLAAGKDQLAVTVSPFIQWFDIATGTVQWRVAGQANGLQGMSAGHGVEGDLGAVFDASMLRKNLFGDAIFIQNVTQKTNGANGAAAGWVFTGENRPNKNTVLIENQTYPILDALTSAQAPDYDANLERPVSNDVTQRIVTDDSPQSGFPADSGFLSAIDLYTTFRMYLVWRYPGSAQSSSIIYPIAYYDWNVTFCADQYVADQGVTRIRAESGIRKAQSFVRSHEVPKLLTPVANEVTRIQ